MIIYAFFSARTYEYRSSSTTILLTDQNKYWRILAYIYYCYIVHPLDNLSNTCRILLFRQLWPTFTNIVVNVFTIIKILARFVSENSKLPWDENRSDGCLHSTLTHKPVSDSRFFSINLPYRCYVKEKPVA